MDREEVFAMAKKGVIDFVIILLIIKEIILFKIFSCYDL
jgi:hypothetical protein